MPILAGGVYHHTDAGRGGAASPPFYSVNDGLIQAGGSTLRHDNQRVWSYTVPAATKVALHSLSVHGAAPGALGSILNLDIKNNRKALAILDWSVDAVSINTWQGLGRGDSESISGTDTEDNNSGEVFVLGDGLQFTAGQVFAATAVAVDNSLTDGKIFGQVHRLRLWGKRTDTGAFVSLAAYAYPADLGTWDLFWNGTEDTSYTVPAGGFTLLGWSWQTDAIPDYTLMLHGNFRLNGNPFMDIGPVCTVTEQTTQPIDVPLWGVELYPGDVLELQGSCNAPCNQAITVLLTGVETALGSSETFVMRAYNTALLQHVYWEHTAADVVGTYSGYDPGDLGDIVLISIVPG